MRERFFTPGLRFKNYEELNAWLHDKLTVLLEIANSRPAKQGGASRNV